MVLLVINREGDNTMKKHIIWSNENLDAKDWKDYIEEQQEETGETYDENKQMDMITDLNNDYLGDERMNLDIPIDGKIIAIASLGLWNGTKQGYKIYNTLPDILYSECDSCTWYVEGSKVLFTGHHHDGTNHVEYRVLNGNRDSDNFTSKIYNGEEITKGMIQYYTKPLAPYIKNVYGWK